MAQNEIRIGDIGTDFIGTIQDGSTVVDISGASVSNFVFFKPDETILEVTGSLVNDGTDGKLHYVSVTGNLNVCGKWRWQGIIRLGTSEWRTDIHEFKVHANLL